MFCILTGSTALFAGWRIFRSRKQRPFPICVVTSTSFLPVAMVRKDMSWLALCFTSLINHSTNSDRQFLQILYFTDKIFAHTVPTWTFIATGGHPIGVVGLSYAAIMFYCRTKKISKTELSRSVCHGSIHLVGSLCTIATHGLKTIAR
jgi:hypothetical protein